MYATSQDELSQVTSSYAELIAEREEVPTLSAWHHDVSEGTSVVVTVEIEWPRDPEYGIPLGDLDAVIIVDYSIDPGGDYPPTEGLDYHTQSGTLTFVRSGGASYHTIPVQILSDNVVDPHEFVTLTLATPSGGAQIRHHGRVGIDDSNSAAISVTGLTVVEGDLGDKDALFTVSVNSPVEHHDVVIDYTIEGISAVLGEDFSNGYNGRTGTLIIPAGQSTVTIDVPISGDTIVENDETFRINLSNPRSGPGVSVAVATAQAIGTIRNDDRAAISISDATVAEGNAGTKDIVFTVNLGNPSALAITMAYATANGTAIAGRDYIARSGTLAFNPGETTKTVTVPILGDRIGEVNETFLLNLSNPTGIDAIIADGQAVGTIHNDDFVGGAGNDTVNGTAAADFLHDRSGGNDVLRGLGGNDTLAGGPGSDYLDGGAGVDTADYSGSGTAQIIIDWRTGTITGGEATGDAHVSIENLILANGPDRIVGSNLANRIIAGGGGDEVLGLDGNDSIDGGASPDFLEGNDGNDTLKGGNDGDVLIGGRGNDSLLGEAGADRLVGGPGNDTIDGGAQGDFLDYRDSTGAVSFKLVNGEQVGAADGLGGTDVLQGIENVYLGSGNDSVTGDGALNRFFGFAGNDTLQGGDGPDNLEGWAGNDRLEGGTGSDILAGGLGNDVLDGGAAFDAVEYTHSTAGVSIVMTSGGNATRDEGGGADTLIAIEQAIGSSFGDTIAGSTLADEMSGLDGNDLLSGAAGADLLQGGGGNDTITGGAGNDRMFGGHGTDLFRWSATALGAGDLTAGTRDVLEAAAENRLDLTDEVEAALFIGGTSLAARTGDVELPTNFAGGTNICFTDSAIQIDRDGDGSFSAAADVEIVTTGVAGVTYLASLDLFLLA